MLKQWLTVSAQTDAQSMQSAMQARISIVMLGLSLFMDGPSFHAGGRARAGLLLPLRQRPGFGGEALPGFDVESRFASAARCSRWREM
jgi:hypothetical protein